MLGKLRVEIVGLEWLLQQWKHNEIGDQGKVVPFTALAQQGQVFVQFFIVNNPFHPLKVPVVILCNQVLRIACNTLHPCPLTLCFVTR